MVRRSKRLSAKNSQEKSSSKFSVTSAFWGSQKSQIDQVNGKQAVSSRSTAKSDPPSV